MGLPHGTVILLHFNHPGRYTDIMIVPSIPLLNSLHLLPLSRSVLSQSATPFAKFLIKSSKRTLKSARTQRDRRATVLVILKTRSLTNSQMIRRMAKTNESTTKNFPCQQ